MSIQATSNDYFTTLSLDPPITNNKLLELNCWGMKPNTKYEIYVNDVEFGWATKQWGKNLGDDLISDEKGQITVYVLSEIPFEASYAYDHDRPDNSSPTRNKQTDSKPSNIVNTLTTIELRAPNSIITIMRQTNILVTLGHPNRSEHHKH